MRIGIIGAVLEHPGICQQEFNAVVSEFQGVIKGRMGLPFDKVNVGVISLTVVGSLDQINQLTGRLGRIPYVTVKATISKVGFEGDLL